MVADLPTEAVSEVTERDRGLLDDDVTVIRDVCHDQGSALIMMANNSL